MFCFSDLSWFPLPKSSNPKGFQIYLSHTCNIALIVEYNFERVNARALKV